MNHERIHSLAFKEREIVSLLEWKSSLELKDYLNVLSFHELINEADFMIRDLNHTPLTRETIQKAKLLLNEYTMRIHNESIDLQEKFLKVYQILECKIKEMIY